MADHVVVISRHRIVMFFHVELWVFSLLGLELCWFASEATPTPSSVVS
jgi:hypothetical protein